MPQDWKFSAPKLYLRYIEWRYGAVKLRRLHAIGKNHDENIKYLGWSLANLILRHELKSSNFGFWDVRMPVGFLTFIYRFFPQRIKDFYHKLISKKS